MCMRSIILSLWTVRLCHIFPHYLTNGWIFEKKKFIEHTMCFWNLYTNLSETFLVLKSINWDIIKHLYRHSCQISFTIVGFKENMNFLDKFPINPQISNFIKIRPTESDLLHADWQMDGTIYRQTDRHDEAKNRAPQFCEGNFCIIRRPQISKYNIQFQWAPTLQGDHKKHSLISSIYKIKMKIKNFLS
jgi:hypothetical protein